MIFNSHVFILALCFICLLHRCPFSWRIKKLNLLWASYVLYAAWHAPFVLLLAFSTVVDWFVGRALTHAEGPRLRRTLLIASLLCNLGLLAFFKYGEFVLENLRYAVLAAGYHWTSPETSIMLPVGISF